jgi:cytochrome d ubiquinol oxidase subunit II
MAVVLGVALGNVIRGVPIDGTGFFEEDLFIGLGPYHAAAIDGYTVVVGLFSLVALGAHGATFLAWKTDGALAARARRVASRLWGVTLALLVVTTILTAATQRPFFASALGRPWLWPLPLAAIGAAIMAVRDLATGKELRAFLASCGFLVAMLVATAASLYPVILRSSLDPAFTLDIDNAASGAAGLAAGLLFWTPAVVLAIGYFVYLFRSFRGKAEASSYHD